MLSCALLRAQLFSCMRRASLVACFVATYLANNSTVTCIFQSRPRFPGRDINLLYGPFPQSRPGPSVVTRFLQNPVMTLKPCRDINFSKQCRDTTFFKQCRDTTSAFLYRDTKSMSQHQFLLPCSFRVATPRPCRDTLKSCPCRDIKIMSRFRTSMSHPNHVATQKLMSRPGANENMSRA